MSATTKTQWILAVTGAMLALLAVASIGFGADLGTIGIRDRKPDLLNPQAAAPSGAALRTLSVLSDTALQAKAGDLVPARTEGELGIKPGTEALAARLGDGDGGSVLVAPASGGICQIAKLAGDDDDVYSGCVSEAQAISGKTVSASGCNQTGIAVYGLMPDGVDSVSITTRGGDTSTVAVEHNTYALSVPAKSEVQAMPAQVSWKDGDQGGQAPIPVPRDPGC